MGHRTASLTKSRFVRGIARANFDLNKRDGSVVSAEGSVFIEDNMKKSSLPPVVIIGDWLSPVSLYSNFMNKLDEEGYRTICISQMGVESPLVLQDPELYVPANARVIEAYLSDKKIHSFILISHGSGLHISSELESILRISSNKHVLSHIVLAPSFPDPVKSLPNRLLFRLSKLLFSFGRRLFFKSRTLSSVLVKMGLILISFANSAYLFTHNVVKEEADIMRKYWKFAMGSNSISASISLFGYSFYNPRLMSVFPGQKHKPLFLFYGGDYMTDPNVVSELLSNSGFDILNYRLHFGHEFRPQNLYAHLLNELIAALGRKAKH